MLLESLNLHLEYFNAYVLPLPKRCCSLFQRLNSLSYVGCGTTSADRLNRCLRNGGLGFSRWVQFCWLRQSGALQWHPGKTYLGDSVRSV
jgi:hypothetical protein